MIEKNVLADEKSNDDSVLEWSVKNGKVICYYVNDDCNILEIMIEDFDILVKFVDKCRVKTVTKEKK